MAGTPAVMTITNYPVTLTISGPNSHTTVISALTQTSQTGVILPVVLTPDPPNPVTTINLPNGFGFPPPADSTSRISIPSSQVNTDNHSPNDKPTSTPDPTAATQTSSQPLGSTSGTAPRNTNTSNTSVTPTGASGSASTRHTDSKSISPGAAAGIGIGCAVAGALIAAAILALLFSRRRRQRPTRSDVIPLNGFASVDKGVSSPPDPPSPAGIVERNLPPPAEDKALGGELSRLRTSIKNHVQSYYHTDSVVGSVDQAALGLIAAGNMPLIASSLGSLLSNPATRLTAIRFCIAWVAISRIELNCEPSKSFLPPEIAGCLTSIAGAREDPSTRMAFMSRWRAITASLLQSKYGGNTFTSYDPRNQNISEALQALDTVVSSFAAEKRDDRARTQNLEEILRRGARFGFLLFSQPSTWELEWNAAPSAGRGVLAVSPALVQVGDENGKRLPKPRVVEEQELAKGLESYL